MQARPDERPQRRAVEVGGDDDHRRVVPDLPRTRHRQADQLRHGHPSAGRIVHTGTPRLGQQYAPGVHRIFTTSVASVYPHYVAKVEKKGRTQAELHQVIAWLTGYDEAQLQAHLDAGTTFEDFFAAATLNPSASLITGTICGVRIQEIDDPLMRQIRYLDKLVDELAKGRPMAKVLRDAPSKGQVSRA